MNHGIQPPHLIRVRGNISAGSSLMSSTLSDYWRNKPTHGSWGTAPTHRASFSPHLMSGRDAPTPADRAHSDTFTYAFTKHSHRRPSRGAAGAVPAAVVARLIHECMMTLGIYACFHQRPGRVFGDEGYHVQDRPEQSVDAVSSRNHLHPDVACCDQTLYDPNQR